MQVMAYFLLSETHEVTDRLGPDYQSPPVYAVRLPDGTVVRGSGC